MWKELIRVFDATDTEDKYKGSTMKGEVVHGTLQVNFSCINAEQEFLIENFIFQCISTNFLFWIFILYAFWRCLGKNLIESEIMS